MRIIFCILIMLCFKFYVNGQFITPDHNITLTHSGPWKLVYEDDFNNYSQTTKNWYFYTGAMTDDMDKAIFYNLPENVDVSSSNLILSANREAIPIDRHWWWNGDHHKIFDYTSSYISSKKYFGYGLYEARLKIPKGRGFYTSFWMFGDVFNYTEVDVFEFHGIDNYKKVSTNVHYPDIDNDESQSQCMGGWLNNIGSTDPDDDFCADLPGSCATDFSGDYYTWSLDWEPDRLIWKVDGNLVRIIYKYTFAGTNTPVTDGILQKDITYQINPKFPEGPMQVLFGFVIDAGYYRPDNSTDFSQKYYVDWFKFYQHDPCAEINITQDYTSNSPNNLIENNQFDLTWNYLIGTDINISSNVNIGFAGTYEMIAKNQIKIGPGFHVARADDRMANGKPGWNFHAHIDPSICNESTLRQTAPPNTYHVKADSVKHKTIESLGEKPINETEINPEEHPLLFSVDSLKINDATTNITISENIELKVYPNPHNGIFEIEFNNANAVDYKIILFNENNMSVYQNEKVTVSPVRIDMRNLSKGVYILQILSIKSKKSFINKVIYQ